MVAITNPPLESGVECVTDAEERACLMLLLADEGEAGLVAITTALSEPGMEWLTDSDTGAGLAVYSDGITSDNMVWACCDCIGTILSCSCCIRDLSNLTSSQVVVSSTETE